MKNGLRIVSLLPSATEIVCALGLEENLAGVTHECDYPQAAAGKPVLTASRISHETMTSAEIDHAVRSQLDGHGSIYDLDTELLERLKPDLIITQELCEVCAVSYKTVEKAARMFVADARVVSLEPNTVEDIFGNIVTVGELCGVREYALGVVAALRNRMSVLREKTAGLTLRPSVFLLEWLEPPFAPGHWTPEQTEAAGGVCLIGRPGEKSVAVTYDEIAAAAPDILVLVPCGYYKEDIIGQIPNTAFPESFMRVPAVANNEVWALDATSYFSRPGPRVVDGAEILAKIFHPEIFGRPTEDEAVRISLEGARTSLRAVG
jgi:iron complex transport system substrate-binding protein